MHLSAPRTTSACLAGHRSQTDSSWAAAVVAVRCQWERLTPDRSRRLQTTRAVNAHSRWQMRSGFLSPRYPWRSQSGSPTGHSRWWGQQTRETSLSSRRRRRFISQGRNCRGCQMGSSCMSSWLSPVRRMGSAAATGALRLRPAPAFRMPIRLQASGLPSTLARRIKFKHRRSKRVNRHALRLHWRP